MKLNDRRGLWQSVVGVVAVALLAAGAQVAYASGSAGGGGAINLYGALYKQGKVVVFQKIACKSGCPLTPADLSSAKAAGLVTALKNRGSLNAGNSENDEIAKNLTSDEAEAVEHYLARRFNIR